MTVFTRPVCRGSYALGTACGKCQRCDEERNTVQLRTTGESFQDRVMRWMADCFSPAVVADRLERGDRFLEESLELLQSGGYPRERIAALVDYVYGRPVGEPMQEVGGTMVTLAAYCGAHDLNLVQAMLAEITRVEQPEVLLKIRAKQARKPTGSALPGASE